MHFRVEEKLKLHGPVECHQANRLTVSEVVMVLKSPDLYF